MRSRLIVQGLGWGVAESRRNCWFVARSSSPVFQKTSFIPPALYRKLETEFGCEYGW